MPTVKNRRFKSIYIILIISLVLSCIPGSAFAVMKEVGSPSSVTTFNSSEAMTNDYCKATVKGKTMTIQLRTMIPTYEFRLALYGVVPMKPLQTAVDSTKIWSSNLQKIRQKF